MSLVIGIETKRGARGESWGESALSYMAIASEKAITVSSGNAVLIPLDGVR